MYILLTQGIDHNNKQWPTAVYVIDQLEVVGVMKNKHRTQLILLLFCFAQRLSFPRDTRKRESVITRPN